LRPILLSAIVVLVLVDVRFRGPLMDVLLVSFCLVGLYSVSVVHELDLSFGSKPGPRSRRVPRVVGCGAAGWLRGRNLVAVRTGPGERLRSAHTAGELDWMTDVPQPEDLASLQAEYPDQVVVWPLARTSWLGFNILAPPFDDVRVRQALNYAVD